MRLVWKCNSCLVKKEKNQRLFIKDRSPHLLCFCTQCTPCLQPDLSIKKKDDILRECANFQNIWTHHKTHKKKIEQDVAALGEIPCVIGYESCNTSFILQCASVEYGDYFPLNWYFEALKKESFNLFPDSVENWYNFLWIVILRLFRNWFHLFKTSPLFAVLMNSIFDLWRKVQLWKWSSSQRKLKKGWLAYIWLPCKFG